MSNGGDSSSCRLLNPGSRCGNWWVKAGLVVSPPTMQTANTILPLVLRVVGRLPWLGVWRGLVRQASESLDDPSSAAAALPLRRVDAPHRPRLPCYPPVGPSDRLPDLYGSLSALLGISQAYAPSP